MNMKPHKVDFDHLIIDDVISDQEEKAEWYESQVVPREDPHEMSWIDCDNDKCRKHAKYYRQIAEWLKELKKLKEE